MTNLETNSEFETNALPKNFTVYCFLCCHFFATVMLFGVLLLLGLLVWLKECMLSLSRSCHHPVLLDYLLLWLNVEVTTLPFKFFDFSIYKTLFPIIFTRHFFSTLKMWQDIVDIMQIIFLFQGFQLSLAKEVSSIVVLCCGIVCCRWLWRLPLCHHLSICILIKMLLLLVY